jgi:uncharacterized repeat protein (TIGR01451 family)
MFRTTARRLSPLLLVPMLLAVLTGGPAGAMGNHHRDDPNPPEQVANPDLSGACGLDFTLVLDRSQSVGENAPTVKAAANSFLDRLANTGSTASLVSFGTTGTEDVAPTALTSGANLDTLHAAVNNLVFDGDTNWEDGLVKAGNQFAAFPDGKPHLVVVITDGFPNKWNADDGTAGSGMHFEQQAQDEAVVEANAMKAAGVHMFAIGIDGTEGLLTDPLQAISGPDEYPATTLARADWTTVDGFDQLAGALQGIATDLCPPAPAPAPAPVPKSSLRITKSGPTQAHEADQVTYTFTVENTGETAVSGLSITDDVLGSIPVAGTLAPGASVEVKKGYAVPLNRADDVVNTARVCGTAATQAAVCSDPAVHRLDVLHPAVTINKTADPTAITGSGDVTYTYVVKNTGDIALANLAVTDDILGNIATLGSLGIGESVTFSHRAAVTAGSPTRNIGTVLATDPLGRSVTASDDATITITVVLGAVVELPRTGDDSRAPVLDGLALMAGGLCLWTVTRRRKAHRA